jgi:hypothetical protein
MNFSKPGIVAASARVASWVVLIKRDELYQKFYRECRQAQS